MIDVKRINLLVYKFCYIFIIRIVLLVLKLISNIFLIWLFKVFISYHLFSLHWLIFSPLILLLNDSNLVCRYVRVIFNFRYILVSHNTGSSLPLFSSLSICLFVNPLFHLIFKCFHSIFLIKLSMKWLMPILV